MSEPTTVFGPLTEEEQRTAEEEKQRIIENRNQAATRDDIDAEFSYYCLLFRTLEAFMPDEASPDRLKLTRWIHLLVNPLIGPSRTVANRTKRNLYLFMICTSLMTSSYRNFLTVTRKAHEKLQNKFRPKARVRGLATPNVEPIIDDTGVPTSLELALDPSKLEIGVVNFEWFSRHEWDTRQAAIAEVQKAKKKSYNIRRMKKDNIVVPKCSVHDNDECPRDKVHEKIGICLDNQFNFLLTLSTEYEAASEPTIVLWLNALSRIGKDACINMKSIRNDHIMLLVGYLFYDEVKGPFEFNPDSPLEPLNDTIASYITKKDDNKKSKTQIPNAPPLNPVSDTIEAFMNSVPKIEEGVFALFALSGDFFNQ